MEWDLTPICAVNYFGYVYPTYYALPYLKTNNGQIIVLSSVSGMLSFPKPEGSLTEFPVGGLGLPLRTGYCASKFAVNGIVEKKCCSL